MTNIAASPTRSTTMEVWTERARTYATWLAIAGAAFLIGLFVVAPIRSSAQPSNLPASFLALPTGVITLVGEDSSALLPVRIADTSQARMIGFRDVGEDALANHYLLYAQSRQTSGRISYSLEKVRVPLEFAAIDGEGNVVAVAASTLGMERITITEPHRWLLAAKAGTFTHYGIEPGMKLDPEAVRKINL
ncbi:MAG: DUF192 domain-containing protein [Trueperaceae bacterium]